MTVYVDEELNNLHDKIKVKADGAENSSIMHAFNYVKTDDPQEKASCQASYREAEMWRDLLIEIRGIIRKVNGNYGNVELRKPEEPSEE